MVTLSLTITLTLTVWVGAPNGHSPVRHTEIELNSQKSQWPQCQKYQPGVQAGSSPLLLVRCGSELSANLTVMGSEMCTCGELKAACVLITWDQSRWNDPREVMSRLAGC